MKLNLVNNFNRDLFALVVRTYVAHSCSEIDNRNPESPKDRPVIVEKVKIEEEEKT